MLRPNHRGFTLIELLVVISIISLLSSIVLAGLSKARDLAEEAVAKSNVNQMEKSLEMYYADHGYYPPIDGEQESSDVGWSEELVNTLTPNYIPKLPTDPKGKFVYIYEPDSSGQSYQFDYIKTDSNGDDEEDPPPTPDPLVVSATPDSQGFNDSLTVTLLATEPEAQIFYTTDNSLPTIYSTPYDNPITLTDTTSLKFFAWLEDEESAVVTKTYTKTAALPPVAVIIVDEPSIYTPVPGSLGYAPDWGMNLTKGYAPYPIFFQGWASTPREDLVKYEWDFGDGSSKFYGFNAAHVYETPGNYKVSLRVMNGASLWSSPDFINVEIMSRTGKRTYYVDSELGDDSYTGLCQTPDDNGCGPWKTAQKAFASMPRPGPWNSDISTWTYQPGDRILFKRGQTFEVTSNTYINHGFGTGGYYFGAYGSGAKPLIQWKGATSAFMISFGLGSGYIGFVDLQFQFYDQVTGVNGIGLVSANEYTKNILLLRCDFHNPNNGILSINPVDLSRVVSGVFVVDSKIHSNDVFTFSATQIAGGFNSLAIINTTFDNAGNHIAYFEYIDKAVIKNNVFSRPAFGRTTLRITGRANPYSANNIYIANNYFLGWIDPLATGGAHNGGGDRYNYHLVNLGPNGTAEKMINDLIFENNVITNCETCMDITNGENIKIRNNIFVTPSVTNYRKFAFSSYVDWETRPLKNVDFVGNVVILSGNIPTYNTEGIIGIYDFDKTSIFGDRHQNIRIMNNIIYSNGSGRTLRFDKLDFSDLSEFTINNNIHYVTNPVQSKLIFVGNTGYTLSEWQAQTGQDLNSLTSHPLFQSTINVVTHSPGQPSSLAAGIAEADAYKNMIKLSSNSPAINTGFNLGASLFYDFFGTLRPQGVGYDIGAHER